VKQDLDRARDADILMLVADLKIDVGQAARIALWLQARDL
jgi:hypothetical protein